MVSTCWVSRHRRRCKRVARDFAKNSKQGDRRKKASRKASSGRKTASRSPQPSPASGGWRWYGSGVLTGMFLSFLVYLGTLPPGAGDRASPTGAEATAPPAGAQEIPRPRFDFYKVLPEQSIEVEAEPPETARPTVETAAERYLLQAGSFRQREDADARRAELLLLGLEPRIEEARGDNGRWYRVYLGPFDSKSSMAKARSLTAAQDIDTLLLKRQP
jgi:cell division protein FtsN